MQPQCGPARAEALPVLCGSMADSNILKRFLDAGVAFTEMTQARAEAIVKDLVSAGEVQTNQAQAAVTDLLQRSRENTERLLDQVRSDIRSQVESMGLATKVDIGRLERLISTLGGTRRKSKKTTASTSTRATTAKRSTAKKATAKKATAKKTTAKKATAKKTTAKKTTAKRTTKRAPAKAAAKKR